MNVRSDPPIFSFAIITDTHLSDAPDFAEGGDEATGKLTQLYQKAVDRIDAMKPAFVVHLGDMADPVPVSKEYGTSAQVFHDTSRAFSAPYYVVPGNHDIGEKLHKALPNIDDEVSITNASIEQYEQTYGRHYYSFERDGCLFVVINTLLLNSGFDEETAQWDWLATTLVDNPDKRVFVFTHYPMYLADRDEPDYYDNLEEPARTRIIDLLLQHKVEAYFAGHVHNFFYDYLDGLHQTVVPSAGILRTDYMELFRARPSREMGAFDPAKLGFLWVDVYADKHVPHFIRSSDTLPYRTHSWNSAGGSVTMDLRLPWCEQNDIPCAWGLEIFERKQIRNDYPLAALWEMGITDLRVPISDLLNPRVSARIRQLMVLGHRFTIVSFGLPNTSRLAAITDHGEGIKAVEVVALLNQWKAMAPGLRALRQSGHFEVYLNAVRPEVEGWTSHHGMHTDQADEIAQVLDHSDLRGAVDGFVFGIRRDVTPFEGFAAVQNCLSGTGFKPLLHVPNVGMYWSTKHNETLTETGELSRVAETAFVARAHPDASFVIDNFVELERGYVGCHGLVDRFYNPKDGSRILTSLNALLPEHPSKLTAYQTKEARVISTSDETSDTFLICDKPTELATTATNAIEDNLLQTQGKLIQLASGVEAGATLREALQARSQEPVPQPPSLLMVPRVRL